MPSIKDIVIPLSGDYEFRSYRAYIDRNSRKNYDYIANIQLRRNDEITHVKVSLGQLDDIIGALNSVRKDAISAREIRTRSGDRPSAPSSDTAWNFPGMADFSSFRRSKSAP